MAIRAAAFDEVNGFDERFPLYFEENDFLRRVAGPILYVPNARCRHLYNQSAAGSPEAAASYARSESAYLKKWGGAWAKTIERARPPAPLQQEQRGATRDMVAEMVIEASPLPDFETAAGHFTTNARVEVLDDIWNAYRGDVLYMRAVTRQGRVIATWTRARMTS
jgi:hypothetical protein